MPDLYTWTEARQELADALGGRTGINTRLDRYLNWAQGWMAKCEIELPRLEVVVTGVRVVDKVSEYNLRSIPGIGDFQDVLGIRLIRNDTDNYRLWRFGWEEYRGLSTQATGSPIRWSRSGNLLSFDPQPDKTYLLRIDYRRRPRRDTVELDSEWHDLWISLALFRAWERLQQYGESVAVFRSLPTWVQTRLQHPLSEEDWENLWDEPRVVPSVRQGGIYV